MSQQLQTLALLMPKPMAIEKNRKTDKCGDGDEFGKFGDYGAPPAVDLSQYHQPGYGAGGSKAKIMVWWLVQAVAFPLTLHASHGVRRWLLRLFGAKIGQQVAIRPTARVTYPWNIEIGDHSWIGDDVVLYSLVPIKIGRHCVISQKSYLCTGSHDISDPRFGLATGEIVIENGAWVATDCFVGPDVRIGANAIIGARSTVLSAMPPAQICFGTPCVPVKPRPLPAEPIAKTTTGKTTTGKTATE